MNPKPNITFRRECGLTLIEILVGLVAGGLVLAGAYSLWTNHNQQAFRLEKKLELSNQITLSSKKITRAITLAGVGLAGAANLAKEDAVGSDSLIIYTNPLEINSTIINDISSYDHSVQVTSPQVFNGARYIAVSSSGSGEVRAILRIEGHAILITAPFSRGFMSATSTVYPAIRECYFTDQEANHLVMIKGSAESMLATNIRNFQVSFRNKRGESTEIQSEIRTVLFSFTGVYPAKEGALSSMIFSSTAIPRNIL